MFMSLSIYTLQFLCMFKSLPAGTGEASRNSPSLSLPPAASPRSDTDGQRLRKSLSSHVTHMGAPGPDLGFTWAVEKKQGSDEQHQKRHHCHFLLQGILPTLGLNPCPPQCRRILYDWATRGNQVRPLGWALIQYNWCSYRDRKFGHQ